jgi:hypothetical protein
MAVCHTQPEPRGATSAIASSIEAAQIEVFHKDGDYRAFVELIGLACQRIPMRVLA